MNEIFSVARGANKCLISRTTELYCFLRDGFLFLGTVMIMQVYSNSEELRCRAVSAEGQRATHVLKDAEPQEGTAE